MIGRLHHVVLDCPDPAALAAFYSELLGLPVTYRSDDWVVVAASETSSGPAFQLARGGRRRFPGDVPEGLSRARRAVPSVGAALQRPRFFQGILDRPGVARLEVG